MGHDQSTSYSIGLPVLALTIDSYPRPETLRVGPALLNGTLGQAITLVLRLLHVLAYHCQCTMDMDHVSLSQSLLCLLAGLVYHTLRTHQEPLDTPGSAGDFYPELLGQYRVPYGQASLPYAPDTPRAPGHTWISR